MFAVSGQLGDGGGVGSIFTPGVRCLRSFTERATCGVPLGVLGAGEMVRDQAFFGEGFDELGVAHVRPGVRETDLVGVLELTCTGNHISDGDFTTEPGGGFVSTPATFCGVYTPPVGSGVNTGLPSGQLTPSTNYLELREVLG